MDRRSVFTVSAITALGLMLLPSSSIAQQDTLKQQLVGTWTTVSYEVGNRQIANPKGMLMFDAGGRYTNIQVRGDRPKYKSASAPTPEEIAANLRDFVAANFGRWSVNEADKTLTRHVDGAITPNTEGTEFKQTVSLSGDELRLTTVTPGPRGAAGSIDVFRRAR